MNKLFFFDIDMTLVTTCGAGMHAFRSAGKALYGDAFDIEGVVYAGRLDPLIMREMLETNGIEPSRSHMDRLRDEYFQRLPDQIENGPDCTALPGVLELIDALRERDDVVLGVLTGNFGPSARIKLKSCGLDPEWFPIKVWGDDSPHEPPERNHLPAVGFERYEAIFGEPIEPARSVVIGDTPHDIGCARANGCRALAVATGHFDASALSEADVVFDDLSNTQEVLKWLM